MIKNIRHRGKNRIIKQVGWVVYLDKEPSKKQREFIEKFFPCDSYFHWNRCEQTGKPKFGVAVRYIEK